MSEKTFTGTVSQMRKDNKFLSAEEFIGAGEVEMTILEVLEFADEMGAGGKKMDGHSLRLDKTEKRLVVRSAVRKVLAASFGRASSDWIGKKIKLYAQNGIRNPSTGEIGFGIRIKTDKTPSK